MTKLPKKVVEDLGTIINDAKKVIPVSVLKSLYIMGDDSVEDLARRYKISVNRIEKYIQAGEWETLRAENREKGLTILTGEVGSLIEDLLDLQKQGLQLKIMQLKEKTEDVKRHIIERGTFKKVDIETGMELRGVDGEYDYVKLPGNRRELNEVKESVEIIGGLVKLLQNIVDREKEINPIPVNKKSIKAQDLLDYDKENKKE